MTSYRIRGPELATTPIIEWRSVLDGVTFRFRIEYRERYDCWDIQLSAADGTILVDGIRVTEGFPLFSHWSDIRFPRGTITCVDTRGLGAHPTRNDWRERHFLRYDAHETTTVDNGLRTEITPI